MLKTAAINNRINLLSRCDKWMFAPQSSNKLSESISTVELVCLFFDRP